MFGREAKGRPFFDHFSWFLPGSLGHCIQPSAWSWLLVALWLLYQSTGEDDSHNEPSWSGACRPGLGYRLVSCGYIISSPSVRQGRDYIRFKT